MFQTLLVLHMLGLSIGAGTGIYIAAVSRHAARNLDHAEARALMPGIAGAISGVGAIGLGLLILSGIGLVAVMGTGALGTAFWIKMALVAAIVAYVVTLHVLARRLRDGDARAVALKNRLAPVGPLLAVLTLIAAVAAFN